MDKELIERLAREADLEFSATVGLDGEPNEEPTTVATLDDLRRFAALMAEECAKLAEQCGEAAVQALSDSGPDASAWCDHAADAIRAKFKA